ncbi:glycosyltransferase [Peribacillus sp. SIMBA_075]|uniref:glycosyltransferase n=1 Tax=Peribacillus sp. SIMBA_075 TaxID=3085813 RepID=UPI00397C2FB5
MKEPVKVLHVLFDLGSGGVETMLYNYYSTMDRNIVHFDFLIHSDSQEIGLIERKVLNMGSKVYKVTPITKNLLKSSKEIVNIIMSNDYDIIHSHTKFFSCVPLIAAKFRKTKLKVSHSHSLGSKRGWLYNVFSYPFRMLTGSFSDYRFAASNDAGRNLFGTKYKFEIFPNAIYCNNFLFNPQIREQERKILNLNNEFLIGLIGRHDPVKNHLFALEIFKSVNDRVNNTKLVFIGRENEDVTPKIKNKIKQLGLEKSVLIKEPRDDIYNFYQGLDLLLIPSKSEGLGIVAIEAQVAGLRCLCSDMVPNEVDITPLVNFLSLDCDYKLWVDKIIRYIEDDKFIRKSYFTDVSEQGYDVKEATKKFEKFYVDSV